MNTSAINANRAAALRNLDSQRTSEVARIASDLTRTTPGLTRTEALRAAERFVPPSR